MVLNKEPRIEWTDLVGGLLIYLGFLMFLTSLHILSINTSGNTSAVLTTIFIVSVTVYLGMIIFGAVGIITQILRWLTWSINTPTWKKNRSY